MEKIEYKIICTVRKTKKKLFRSLSHIDRFAIIGEHFAAQPERFSQWYMWYLHVAIPFLNIDVYD